MEFKVRTTTPSQYRSPAKQFFAEHAGIVLTTLIVIICICIVIRAQLSSSDEETGPTQSTLFDPLPDQQRPRDAGQAAPHSQSSLDARPLWGMAPPAEDGGPIEGKPPDEKPAEAPPAPPSPGTGGLAIPNFPMPALPVEEVKKHLPKPSGSQQGSSRSVGGGGTYQPAASVEDQERKKKEEEARRKAAPANQALGYEAQQAGKPNLTRKRQTIAVDKGVSNLEDLQKTGVQKEIIYTLQQISQQVQQRTQESGTPAAITANEARDIERAIGIMQGGKDKMPSPNSNQ